jgi:hypothetical protein
MRSLNSLMSKLNLSAASRRQSVHFLHVGKCGGTAIKDLAVRVNALPNGPKIIGHGHSTKLHDLSPSAPYFFAIRNPVTRFYSAFYMRKSKEQPRLYREWTDGERAAYEQFPEANDLAESLFSESRMGRYAFEAMQNIGHMSYQHSWFKISDVLDKRQPISVLRQEKLAEDVARLLRKLGVDDSISLPADNTKAHRNEYFKTPPLSEKGVRNLQIWYAADIEYYRLINEWVEAGQKS